VPVRGGNVHRARQPEGTRRVKRFFDILGAILALLILALPMLIIAILIRARLGSPVLFRQRRAGLHGIPFELVKFRTMANASNRESGPSPDAARIKPFGRFLRATSCDELPELWNVLRGEMSFVGPRPLLMQYLPLYSPDQARRHTVRPGLTGWAQINGRNAISWPERFRLDLWYIDHAGFWLDLRILVLTIFAVLGRRGISSKSEVTMPFFRGNQEAE
jgi:lipopolysaccharide/colanic/teichoic acid biosynthesis glycosyltransferase